MKTKISLFIFFAYLIVQLHGLKHNPSEGHLPEGDCVVCQILLTSPGIAIHAVASFIAPLLELFQQLCSIIFSVYITHFYIRSINPRPPPVLF